MAELKTLIDIDYVIKIDDIDGEGSAYANMKDLRQEAIKKVKELHNKIEEAENHEEHNCPNWYECEDTFYSHCRCHIKYQAQIEYILWFNNLTEEDLKS